MSVNRVKGYNGHVELLLSMIGVFFYIFDVSRRMYQSDVMITKLLFPLNLTNEKAKNSSVTWAKLDESPALIANRAQVEFTRCRISTIFQLHALCLHIRAS